MKRWVVPCVMTVVLFSLILLVVSWGQPAAPGLPLETSDMGLMNEGWQLSVNATVIGPCTLPENSGANAGDVVRLERKIPQHSGELFFAMRTSHQYVRAYVDGELVYAYGFSNQLPYSSSPGTLWNLFDISGGKTMMLELSCPYQNHAGLLTESLAGERYALWYRILADAASALIFTFVTFILGIMLCLVGVVMLLRAKANSLLYLGLFTLFASIWAFAETGVLNLLLPMPFLITQSAYISLNLCLVATVLFIRSFYQLQNHLPSNLVLLTGCAITLVSIVLQLFRITDFVHMLVLTHNYVIGCAVYVLWVIIRKRRFIDKIGHLLFIAGFACLVLFTSLDLIDYLRFMMTGNGPAGDRAFFFRIGFILFIILLSAASLRQGLSVYSRGAETRVISKMVDTDMMTGLHSRHAFDTDMEGLTHTASENLCMVMLDLIGLKKINDSMGNKQGDALIVATAKIISSVFGRYGRCYRIGGDEFVALMSGMSEPLLDEKLQQLQWEVSQFNRNNKVQIDVALGYDFYRPGQDENIQSLFIRVNAQMYAHKRDLKQLVDPVSG